MSDSSERGRIAKDVKLSHEQQHKLVHDLKDKGYSNAAIAHIMRLNESTVRILLKPKGES